MTINKKSIAADATSNTKPQKLNNQTLIMESTVELIITKANNMEM